MLLERLTPKGLGCLLSCQLVILIFANMFFTVMLWWAEQTKEAEVQASADKL